MPIRLIEDHVTMLPPARIALNSAPPHGYSQYSQFMPGGAQELTIFTHGRPAEFSTFSVGGSGTFKGVRNRISVHFAGTCLVPPWCAPLPPRATTATHTPHAPSRGLQAPTCPNSSSATCPSHASTSSATTATTGCSPSTSRAAAQSRGSRSPSKQAFVALSYASGASRVTLPPARPHSPARLHARPSPPGPLAPRASASPLMPR